MQSEVFRFGNPNVDDWEGQLNAWPLDEGLIDYVAADYQYALGNPGATANIIANTRHPGRRRADRRQPDRRRTAGQPQRTGRLRSERRDRLPRHRIPALGPGPERHRRRRRPASGQRFPARRRRHRRPQRTSPRLPEGRHRPAGQRSARHGRPVAARRCRQLPRQPGRRAGHQRPAQDAVRHGQPVAGRAGRRAHEGLPGSQLHRRRARLLQRQHPQLALLQRQGHPQHLPGRIPQGRRRHAERPEPGGAAGHPRRGRRRRPAGRPAEHRSQAAGAGRQRPSRACTTTS